jgi:hypothetical protein
LFGEARRRVVLRVLSRLRAVNESRSTLLLRNAGVLSGADLAGVMTTKRGIGISASGCGATRRAQICGGRGGWFRPRALVQAAGVDLDAKLGANGSGDGGGVVVHEGFGFGLDHDAGEGLSAGVADDDAAGVGEREFGGGDGPGNGGDLG